MQSQPEKNWLSQKKEFACVSRAFKDAGRNCKRIKSDTGIYFDPFSGAATDERNLERKTKPFRYVSGLVCFCGWMSIDQCGAPILLSCQKKHLNLGRCVLQFPVKKTHTKYTPQTGRCILVRSHQSCPQRKFRWDRCKNRAAPCAFFWTTRCKQLRSQSEGRMTQGKEYDYYFILLYHKKIVSLKNRLWKQRKPKQTCRKKITKKETFLCQNCLVVFLWIAIRSWFPPGVKPPTSWCPLRPAGCGQRCW